MNHIRLKMQCALAIFIAGLLAAGPSIADKPSWAGKGNKEHGEGRDDDGKGKNKNKNKNKNKENRGDDRRSHFEDRHRAAVRDYYEGQSRSGRCPPGLAKKRNGCMPPGQAKKWQVGRPLPRDVVYYQVPQTLVTQIGPPPSGYRYVRVATDVLLIAIATGIVADAIADFGR